MRLYQVSCDNIPGLYVSPDAPIGLKLVPSVLLFQMKVKVPSPDGETLVSGAAAVFSHIDWLSAMEPGWKLLTVTLMIFDSF